MTVPFKRLTCMMKTHTHTAIHRMSSSLHNQVLVFLHAMCVYILYLVCMCITASVSMCKNRIVQLTSRYSLKQVFEYSVQVFKKIEIESILL